MGCPIRKSPDLRLFAPTRGLSQLITPFIVSMCLGIPRTPLVALPKCCSWRWLGYIESPDWVIQSFQFPNCQKTKNLMMWSWQGSNLRPPECKSGALPTELQPHKLNGWQQIKWACVDSNHGPHPYQGCALTTWATSPFWWNIHQIKNFPKSTIHYSGNKI